MAEAGASGRVLLVVSVAAHLTLAAFSSFLAVWLRFDGIIPATLIAAHFQTLPALLLLRFVTFFAFGLYGGLWRYTGVWDLSRIVLAVLVSSGAIYLVVDRLLAAGIYPRSIVIIDSLLLISMIGGVRLLWRIIPPLVQERQGRRVLILGAGDAGEMIVREMRKRAEYEPVGFIDQDAGKVGRTIHGVTVLGTPHDLPRVLAATKPSEVLVAIPSASAPTIRDLVRSVEPFKLPITTLPSLRELVCGQAGIGHIRRLAIGDLLLRSPVTLRAEEARHLIAGKRVLVTGAGGSIGSELCRHVAELEPASLILFERYENSLYAIANEMADRFPDVAVQPFIGDATDADRVDAVLSRECPHIIFHAAAHKRVPLMEANPCEAVKNNVAGTRTVAEAARRFSVERFILISTDKAVNPSSVMGTTKRVAELIVEAIGSGSESTRFVTVRFGNVLGSNGSVIPRMMEQIRAGGPVTVTHPEIRRYFMLIPEAVQLVLQAAMLARQQETFVLDMGEQIKVLDIARNLIRLSGFVPDEDIPITFIGLRPGEKLAEELVAEGEALEPAGADRIFRVRSSESMNIARLMENIDNLTRTARRGNSQVVLQLLRDIVPTFRRAPTASPALAPPVPARAAADGSVSVQPATIAISASAS